MDKSLAARNALLEGPILRSLLTLAVPIMLATILQSAYQLTFLMIALGAGMAIAGSTLIAQYYGAGNQTMVDHVAAQTLIMVVLASVAFGSLGYVMAPTVLRLMGVEPDVLLGAIQFLRVSFVGLVFVFSFAMIQAVLRGVGEVRGPVVIVLGTVLLNFALDPLLIFGAGPVPATGVAGAALATVFTQSLAAVAGLGILFSGRFGIKLKPKHFRPDFSFYKRAFLLGLPASIEQTTRGLGLTVMTFLVASFGTVTIAAYGIGFNVLSFVIIPAMGLSMATSALVGQNIGAGNIARATEIATLSATISFTSLTVMGGIVYVGAAPIVRFFVPSDANVLAAGASFLQIVGPSFGFIGLQLALTGVFRASGNMLATMVLALVSQWVLQFPIAYVLSFHTDLGSRGIWWAFPASNVVTAAITVAWFLKGDWKRTRLTAEKRVAKGVSEEILIEEGMH